jgi:tetratricopeptide (TPR) repeat protein
MTEAASEEVPGLPVNQDPARRQILEDAIAFYEQYAAVDSTQPDDRLRQLRALCEIGTIRVKLKQHNEATECLQAAIRQAKQYSDAGGNEISYRRQLADAYARLAASLREQRSWRAAGEMAQEAIAIQADLIARLPDDAMLLSESGQAWNDLALINMGQKQWEQAAGILRQAIDRQQSALKTAPGELACQKCLCDLYVNLNDCLRQGKIGEPEELEACLHQIVYWSEQVLRQQPGAVRYRSMRGDACQKLAELLADSPARLTEATQLAEKAVDCFDALASEYRVVPEYGHRCGHAVDGLAQLMQRRGEMVRCREYLQRALQYLETSVRSAPRNKAYAKCQAVAENNLAWFLVTCTDRQLRDPQLALQHAKLAVDLNPGEGTGWNTLGVAHYCRGEQVQLFLTAGTNVDGVREDPDPLFSGHIEPRLDTVTARLVDRRLEAWALGFRQDLTITHQSPSDRQGCPGLQLQTMAVLQLASHFVSACGRYCRKVETGTIGDPVE